MHNRLALWDLFFARYLPTNQTTMTKLSVITDTVQPGRLCHRILVVGSAELLGGLEARGEFLLIGER